MGGEGLGGWGRRRVRGVGGGTGISMGEEKG